MAHFCPVVPPMMADRMKKQDILGKTHLLLAHDVAENGLAYSLAYPREGIDDWTTIEYKSWTIIMDNSVVELGEAKMLPVIKKALSYVRTDVVVLPDVLLDGEATYQAVMDNWELWNKELNGSIHYGKPRYNFMVVPQGKTLKEWTRCAERLSDIPNVGWWGIPRNLTDNHGSRQEAIQIACALNRQRKIHLLGFSEDLVDDVLCARDPNVYSIDSAVPIRAASLGLRLTLDLTLPKRGDWWEKGLYNPDLTEYNVNKIRELISRMER